MYGFFSRGTLGSTGKRFFAPDFWNASKDLYAGESSWSYLMTYFE
jgi:hypothetical protein